MIDPWIAWLDGTALAQWLRASLWAYPLVNTAHLLGISLLLGAIAAFDLRLLGWRRCVAVTDLARVLLPMARAGFALAVIMGALLFVARAADYVHHPVFQLKLALLALALLNVAWLHRSAWWREHLATGRRDARVTVAAVVSLCAWLGVLLAGRMIGYR